MCSFCFGFNFNFNFNKIKWNIFTVAPGFYSILFFLEINHSSSEILRAHVHPMAVRETFEFFECGEPTATLTLISWITWKIATFRFPENRGGFHSHRRGEGISHGESKGIQESNTPPKRIAGLEQKYELSWSLFRKPQNMDWLPSFWRIKYEISMIYGDPQPWMVDQSAIHPAISLEIPVG